MSLRLDFTLLYFTLVYLTLHHFTSFDFTLHCLTLFATLYGLCLEYERQQNTKNEHPGWVFLLKKLFKISYKGVAIW